MSTKNPVTKTVALNASQFRFLVAPVIPLAEKTTWTLPILSAVLIEGEGQYLTATATDRYRAGVQRIKVDVDVSGFTALVSIRSLRSILSIFKTTRKFNPELTFTVTDTTFAVEAVGTMSMDTGFVSGSMAWPLVDGKYPKVRGIIADAQARAAEGDYLMNPAFLADFQSAQHHGEPMLMRGTPGHPIFVQIGADFVGAIMQPRSKDAPVFDAEWAVHFAASKTEVAA